MATAETVETPEGVLSYEAASESWFLRAADGVRSAIPSARAMRLLAAAITMAPSVAMAMSSSGPGPSYSAPTPS